MQIAEVLVMPTNQATGTIAYKKWFENGNLLQELQTAWFIV
jgi:hypothetical protein